MMKGQMFIIAGLIVIVAIVGLKSILSLQKIVENQRHLVSGFNGLEFNNVRNEMVRTLQISYNDSANMTNNLNDFDSFARDTLNTKSVDFNSLLVEVFYPTLQASTNTQVNVTVYNSLGTDLTSLNLSFNGTSNTFSLKNRYALRTVFTINTAVSNNQTLALNYTTSSTSQSENFAVPLNLGASYFIAFFDIRYISNEGQQSDKFTTTLQLN